MMRPHGIVTIIWNTLFKIATHLDGILSDTDFSELKTALYIYWLKIERNRAT